MQTLMVQLCAIQGCLMEKKITLIVSGTLSITLLG
jgi:hypothetical protein